jgi:hypothetical protein
MHALEGAIMALSLERHETIDGELHRIHAFLLTLAAEIDTAPEQYSFAYAASAVAFAAAQVAYARRLLELAQKKSKKACRKRPDPPPA